MSADHDELLRLAEAVPEERVSAAAAFLRQLVRPVEARREFGSAGAFSDDPGLSENVENILREEYRRPGASG
ncbi:MAG: hypothetical protein HOQ24_08050 [Mycobacteriaceae bacterium]|nr:hypothetical protein [Mycobacteriaceae bacterium]